MTILPMNRLLTQLVKAQMAQVYGSGPRKMAVKAVGKFMQKHRIILFCKNSSQPRV